MRKRQITVATLVTALLITVCQTSNVKSTSSARSVPLLSFTQADGTLGSARFDPDSYYRLTTAWQGECKSLDVISDGDTNQPILAKTSDLQGQYWKITSVNNGFYRLTTMWQGESKSLDIINDGNNNRPVLADTSNRSGQYWKITTIGNDYYRLTTAWQGDSKSLAIINDGENNNRPILSITRNVSAQYWKVSKAKFITAPPASLNLNPFYKKYLDAKGIAIISSDNVPNAALYQVSFMVLHMLNKIPGVLAEMVRHGARIAIMATTEFTTDIPEHAFLSDDWNKKRGLGGTIHVPTSSCAEENVLCYEKDIYTGEDIFIHEFAHSIHKLGFVFTYPRFQKELDAAYRHARCKGLWAETYAIKNAEEYFAEGVQDWFNVNQEANPTNDVHNYVNTREELKVYDTALYNILKKYFPEDENKCSCH